MEIGDSVIMFLNVRPDLPCMRMITVECPVHKFYLRYLMIQEKLQFFFYQLRIPEPELFINGRKNNIDVIPIPGACALINALIASGLNTKQFTFYGFLPLNKKLRKKSFEKIKKENKKRVDKITLIY